MLMFLSVVVVECVCICSCSYSFFSLCSLIVDIGSYPCVPVVSMYPYVM